MCLAIHFLIPRVLFFGPGVVLTQARQYSGGQTFHEVVLGRPLDDVKKPENHCAIEQNKINI